MTHLHTTSALRVIHAAELIKSRLSGEFSSVHGLSVSEFFFLMHLEAAPLRRLPRVEIARRMLLSASTVTRMAAPMEKIGLVGRESDPRDARTAYVVLTDAGLERVKEARATFAKHASVIFGNQWSDQDVEILSGLLHRMTEGSAGDLAG